MAENIQNQKTLLKKKKKVWVPIFGTKNFKDVQFGESLVSEIHSLLNKHIEVNLMEITNDVKKQNIKVRFMITNVADNKAYADIIGYELVGSMVRRIVKRSKSKVEDSFIVESKDNIRMTIKPIVMTKAKVAHSILTKLRAKMREIISIETKKLTYDEIVNHLLNYDMHKMLRDKLKKIFPISIVEVRIFRRL